MTEKSYRLHGAEIEGERVLLRPITPEDTPLIVKWRTTESVRRVFKRVAMSQGAYTGRGAFGALAYLVVQFGNGREKQSRFRHEADVDRLLADNTQAEKSYANGGFRREGLFRDMVRLDGKYRDVLFMAKLNGEDEA